MDDYIHMAISRSKRDLGHIFNSTMHGMHSIFPANGDDSKDPISEKKMIKKDGQWRIGKDVLGWEFEGREKIMVLEAEKIKFILGILN